jgi:hypothetical protein
MDAPAWVGKNIESLLRAPGDESPARQWVVPAPTRISLRNWLGSLKKMPISVLVASSPILLFFIVGGVALHVRLRRNDVSTNS